MSMDLQRTYAIDCDQPGCHADLFIRAANDMLPTPASWARKQARAAGWKFTGLGRNRGWDCRCPQHKAATS